MPVIVNNYNPEWPKMFEEEASKIKNIFGEELVSIHHIGSTSVTGIKAKPIIDIMPVVKNIKLVDDYNKPMSYLGYEAMGEFGISGRRYFRKGKDKRTHHVHVFQYNSNHIERHIAFRDYLREHKLDAKKYADLKERLAKSYPNDIKAYCEGKNEFVKKLEKKALKWYRNRN